MYDIQNNLLLEDIINFFKKNENLIKGKRILLLNVNKQVENVLNILGQIGSKIVGLGKTEDVYDLPFYWRIKYINADLKDVRFPNSLFDSSFIFLTDKELESYIITDELERVLKPKSLIFILFLKKDLLENREEYIRKLETKFEFISNTKNIVYLKSKKEEVKRNINTIYVYHPNLDKDGITEYAKHLIYRLRKRGFKVVEGLPVKEDDNDIVIVEYEELLAYSNKIKKLGELPKNSIIEIHSKKLNEYNNDLTYLYHGIPKNYGLDFSKLKWYYVPHIAYEIEINNTYKKYDYCSFGFWSQFKRFDQIRKLKGRKKLVMSFNYLISDDKFVKDQCKKMLKFPIGLICDSPLVSARNLKLSIKIKYNLLRLFRVKVVIKDYIPFDELLKELSECRAFVFFQETDAPSSGSMRLAAAFGVPVYAKDNLRSKDSQAIRFKDLNELNYLSNIFKNQKIIIDDGLDYILSLILYEK